MAVFKFTYTSEAVNTNMSFFSVIPQHKHIRSEAAPGLLLNSFLKEYPVLFLLHDLHSSPGELIRMTCLERYAAAAGRIVILPEGYLSYYTDYARRDDSPTPMNPATGNPGRFTEMCYEQFIIPELLDYVRELLPVSRSPKDTAIGGIGMGGFGALKLGGKHHKDIGSVFSIEGETDLQWAMDHRKQQKEQFETIFGSLKASGDNDLLSVWSSDTHLPRLYQCFTGTGERNEMNRRFASAVRKSIDYACCEDEGIFDWEYIDSKLKQAMEWL